MKASIKRSLFKYRLGHFSAHTRGVLISTVIVAKQHLLSTGRTRCLITGLYKKKERRYLVNKETLNWQQTRGEISRSDDPSSLKDPAQIVPLRCHSMAAHLYMLCNSQDQR